MATVPGYMGWDYGILAGSDQSPANSPVPQITPQAWSDTRVPTSPTPTAPTAPPASAGPSEEELMRQEIDNIFNPTFNYLNEAASKVSSQLPTVIDEAKRTFEAGRSGLETRLGQTRRTINETLTGAEQRGKEGITAARDLLNELRQAGIQRFGGATSAGQAFGELAAREFQRTSGAISRDLNNVRVQIGNALTKAQEDFNTSVTQLELFRDQTINEAKREFDNKMLEITRLKSEAESNKANLRLQALQELRNRVYQANLEMQQAKVSAAAQYQNTQSELARAEQLFLGSGGMATGAGNAFAGGVSLNPETALTISGQGTTTQNPYIGAVKDDPYELFRQRVLTGQVGPARDQDGNIIQ